MSDRLLCRTVSFKLTPSPIQVAALDRLLDSQRHLYNAALEERIGAWKWNRRSVRLFDQFNLLTGPEAREVIPSLAEFGVQPHRGTLKRLDEAFGGFFRRVAAGHTPGFPRFKGANRWNSVAYPEVQGWGLRETGEKGTYGLLRLHGVGHVKVRLAHGPRSARVRGGVPCKLVVCRRPTGKWEATVFYKNVRPAPMPEPSGKSAGVDRGITVLAAVADDCGGTELVENPRHLRGAKDGLAAKQHRLAHCERGSNRRKKAAADVAATHAKVARLRRESNHQLSRRLVDAYDAIVLEKLQIHNMVRRPAPRPNDEGGWDPNGAAAKAGLNKSISDAGWGDLAAMVSYKAEEAGRDLIFVNPRDTSRKCHACGHVDAGNRDGTVFECLRCGHSDHADLNAARNILRAGVRPRTSPSGVKPSTALASESCGRPYRVLGEPT